MSCGWDVQRTSRGSRNDGKMIGFTYITILFRRFLNRTVETVPSSPLAPVQREMEDLDLRI